MGFRVFFCPSYCRQVRQTLEISNLLQRTFAKRAEKRATTREKGTVQRWDFEKELWVYQVLERQQGRLLPPLFHYDSSTGRKIEPR